MDAQGDWAKAAGHWTSVVLATPNAMVYANRGNCYLKMKKVQKGGKKTPTYTCCYSIYIHVLLSFFFYTNRGNCYRKMKNVESVFVPGY